MVRGNDWKPVIETLPDHINIAEAKELLQSADQLARLVGQGHIAGALVEPELNRDLVETFLKDGELSLENVTLQWLYRFVIVESLCDHNRREPMAEWAPMFLHMIEQGLHFLVVMAAILVLIEEQQLDPGRVGGDNNLEAIVKARVAQACESLHPKAQDYGESFRRHGLVGLLPRLWDKIARYAQLKADSRPGNFEKKEDSALDLLGYCCIAYSLMLELPTGLRKSYQPIGTYETDRVGGEWKKVN